eukprot:358390-Chlamydomonas_euryale.AAC.4
MTVAVRRVAYGGCHTTGAHFVVYRVPCTMCWGCHSKKHFKWQLPPFVSSVPGCCVPNATLFWYSVLGRSFSGAGCGGCIPVCHVRYV